MKLRADLFPYPVLSPELNDYDSGSFETSLEYKQISPSNLELEVTFKLDDKYLLELIKEKKAQYAVHLEGVASSYRALHLLEEFETKTTIPISTENVSGKVEVNTAVIARKDIENYANPNFNEQFYGESYTVRNIHKGDILAFDSMSDLSIDFENKEKPNAGSMIRVAAVNEPYMRVDIDSDVIQVYLPKKAHQAYKVLSSSSKEKQELLLVTVVLPALSYVIERMKTDDYESERSWSIALLEMLNKLNYDENNIKDADAMMVAQQLLDTPIENALFNFYEEGDKIYD